MPRSIEQRAAGYDPTAPRRHPHVEPLTARKTAQNDIKPRQSHDQQNIDRAPATVDELAAVLASLSFEERIRVCALAGVAVVLGHVEQELSPKQAAGRAGVTSGTILRWIARFGIGRRIGGRYYVDIRRLEALVAGVRR